MRTTVFVQACGKEKFCPEGAEQPIACQTCPPGRGEVDPGDCVKGGARDRRCEACKVGMFSAADDVTPCRSCPEGKFSDMWAATGGSECQACVRERWVPPGLDNTTYNDAPNSTFCPGGSVRLVKRGFWRSPHGKNENHTASAGMLTYKCENEASAVSEASLGTDQQSEAWLWTCLLMLAVCSYNDNSVHQAIELLRGADTEACFALRDPPALPLVRLVFMHWQASCLGLNDTQLTQLQSGDTEWQAIEAARC